MAMPPKPTYPHWEQSQSAWIAPGQRLQIPVPICKQGRLLAVDFNVRDALARPHPALPHLRCSLLPIIGCATRLQVISGLDVDFDIILEGEDGTVNRLYGPTRRARNVSTVIEVPFDGDAYVTFDNINSWFVHKHVEYSMGFTTHAESEVRTRPRAVAQLPPRCASSPPFAHGRTLGLSRLPAALP